MITHANTTRNNTYYDILKIDPNASDQDVRQAYLTLAKIYHPDTNPGNRKIAALRLRLINEAYAALKSAESRDNYNRILNKDCTVKPRGLHLHADNDNQNPSQKQRGGFWSDLLSMFKPQKSVAPFDPIASGHIKEG